MTISPVETRARMSFGGEALVLRDLDHLLSDNALSSRFYLSHEVFSQRQSSAWTGLTSIA